MTTVNSLFELPIYETLGDIRQHLAVQHNLVLEAPTGAGKTTAVPLALREEPWLLGRKIIVLQPRRLAAKNAAIRMATMLREPLGATVGYRMRLDTRVSTKTRIEVVTEGILLRMLRDDPSLSDVGLLIFDEFHERSLDADLGLTLALNARDTFEHDEPLRIMLMSATLGTAALEAFLNTCAIRSAGRMFAVTEHYSQASKPRERIVERLIPVVEKAIAKHSESSLLVFLPGKGEIRQLATELKPPGKISIRPLYGELSITEQQLAIEPCPPGQRKIVLATNIAETSLTIEGVDVVIDSGLERKPQFDPNTGMTRLETVKISQASSMQRAGRAGRLRPGSCYRLWSATQQQQLNAHDEPEIRNADLSALTLQLFAFGVYEPSELAWLTPPPPGPYQQAVELLLGLNALGHTDSGLRLTPHGNLMASIAAPPRLAHMLIMGQGVGAAKTAANLAAVLSDRDPLGKESADMRRRLEYLHDDAHCPAVFRRWQKRTQQLAGQFLRQLPRDLPANLSRPTAEQLPGFLIACAYPDRIARQRHSGGYQLANGRSSQFESPGELSSSKWLAVAEMGGMTGQKRDLIRSAAPLDPGLFDTLLKDRISDETFVDWDNNSGRFIAERRHNCGALLLRREPISDVSEDARTRKLLDLTRDAKLANLPWSRDAKAFLKKAQLMSQLEADWPSFETAQLLSTLSEWLSPYLSSITRLGEVKKIKLLEILQSRLTWEQQQQLNIQLPVYFKVPSGSRIKIDYSESPPVLPVKLQEMFGCEQTPSIASGRIVLLVHLLSPAGRPLQITRDLPGFWRAGYEAVKKEMRGRYPKHPWPDDPTTAPPTRHTKHRKKS